MLSATTTPSTAESTSLLASLHIAANQGYTPFDGPQYYSQFPVRLSLPQAPGRCGAADELSLCDINGNTMAMHVRPFLFWPDGSVRVYELWFPLSLARGQRLTLEVHRARGNDKTLPKVKATTPVRCTISVVLEDGTTLTSEVAFSTLDTATSYYTDEYEFRLSYDEETEPLFHGAIVRKQWSWYDGSEWEVRLTNHAGDDENATTVRSVRLEFKLRGNSKGRYIVRQTAHTAHGHPRLTERDNPIDVRADGSVHVTEASQLGEDESQYPAYERDGYVCSAAPWLAMADTESAWLLVLPEALERMPKGWRFEEGKAIIELHPADAEPLSWRQGMTLYQRLVLLRLRAESTPEELENEAQAWLRPPIVRLDSEIYRQAGWRIPFRYEPQRFPRTEFHLRDSFNFSWNYGTFDYGDQIAGTKGGGPMTPGSQGIARNLEYDFPSVAAKEYARTGVYQLRGMCFDSARHMMHTDFVAVSSDPWKEGGIVHHSPQHTTGSAYPSHMWAEGLTLYYQLSGDPHALRVVRRVGGFYLKYIDERFAAVQSTAREVGWTLIALAAIYDTTREERFLDGIRRVVDFNLDQGQQAFFPTDACFTIGVAIIGLDRSRHFHRDADTQQFIIELLEWMMRERRDDIGLFEYWYDPEQGAIPYIQTHLPEALNIGYKLSGDERYLRAAYRLYQMHQDGAQLTVQSRFSPPECGYAAGNHLSWMGCLQSFAEKGWLGQLQYPDPE